MLRRFLVAVGWFAALAAVVWAVRRAAPAAEHVREVMAGDQEVAWIHAATSISAWERFVAGAHRVVRDWPEFVVDDSAAFPEESTAVPELVLSLPNVSGRLCIRWYKLSKDANAAQWVGRLAKRAPPPLAVIGGGSTDRAVDLAEALQRETRWRGEKPVFFITTATASGIPNPEGGPDVPLTSFYPGRTFRMCFTNEQMARAVVDFVCAHPDLRPLGDPTPALGAVMAAIGGGAVEALPTLVAASEFGTPSVSALFWGDDPYSVDLSKQFHKAFHETSAQTVLVRETLSIPFSVGGQYSPNAGEAQAAEHLLMGLACSPCERRLLVLPSSAAPARRVLRSITGALPLVGRNLVAITGDSINMNNVFRDADVAWSARALAVPIVFFAHQDPVGWDVTASVEDKSWVGAARPPSPVAKPAPVPEDAPYYLEPPTATDELLLHRDLVGLLARTAFRVYVGESPGGLMSSADELVRALRGLRPAIFDAAGDRIGGRGEYILVLRPQFFDGGAPGLSQVLPTATLEIWTRAGDDPARSRWLPVKRLILNHARENRSHP